jgi:hypothetical protein
MTWAFAAGWTLGGGGQQGDGVAPGAAACATLQVGDAAPREPHALGQLLLRQSNRQSMTPEQGADRSDVMARLPSCRANGGKVGHETGDRGGAPPCSQLT